MTEQERQQLAKQLQAEKAELEPIFYQICDPKDCKAPIDALVRLEDKEKAARAIAFFTATDATFEEPTPPRAGWVRVKSIGYRAGPAGDH